MPSFNSAFIVVPVHSMAKVAQGFHWKLVEQSPEGHRSLLFFERRYDAEHVCRELNQADQKAADVLMGAA